VLSYRVFFFTLYSLGLRIGEGLRLQVGDIDAARSRVHVRKVVDPSVKTVCWKNKI
jgi:integrase